MQQPVQLKPKNVGKTEQVQHISCLYIETRLQTKLMVEVRPSGKTTKIRFYDRQLEIE